uniref:Uncharacterized protein n=1 Tax=Trichobilharzia regenti TaxID=157069 RepID=A0AA85KIS2_TRIRE|nr:unnamed protein product [Trichobilharzia regenti]
MISKITVVCLLAIFSLQIAASKQENAVQVSIKPKHWLDIFLGLLGELLSGLSEMTKYTIKVAGITDQSCGFWDLSLCTALQSRFGFFGGNIPKHPAHNNVVRTPKPPDADHCRVPDNYTFPDVYLTGMADYLNTTFWTIKNLTDGHTPKELKHLLEHLWDLQVDVGKLIPPRRNVCVTPVKIFTGPTEEKKIKITVQSGAGHHLDEIETQEPSENNTGFDPGKYVQTPFTANITTEYLKKQLFKSQICMSANHISILKLRCDLLVIFSRLSFVILFHMTLIRVVNVDENCCLQF